MQGFYAIFEDKRLPGMEIVRKDGHYDGVIEKTPEEMVKEDPETYLFGSQAEAQAALDTATERYDAQHDDGTEHSRWSVSPEVLEVQS